MVNLGLLLSQPRILAFLSVASYYLSLFKETNVEEQWISGLLNFHGNSHMVCALLLPKFIVRFLYQPPRFLSLLVRSQDWSQTQVDYASSEVIKKA